VKKNLVILCLMLLFATVAVQADETSKTKAAHETFDGTLVCLGCDLKKAEGARAACSVFGHKHALKTADGKYVNLLENQYSKDLLAGEKYHDKQISIHGIYYATANQLDVETFTIDGKQKGWCDGCKSMDGCAVKSDM
jgi:hypothetical protein